LVIFRSEIVPDRTLFRTALVSGAVILALFLIFYFKLRSQMVAWVRAMVHKSNIERFKIVKIILDKVRESLESFKVLNSRKLLISSLLYTVLIIFFQYVFYYFIMKGIGLEINFFQVMAGSVFILLIAVLPIQGVAGLGTFEGAWSIALIYFGIAGKDAISASFVLHTLQLAYLIVIGLAGLMMRQKNLKT